LKIEVNYPQYDVGGLTNFFEDGLEDCLVKNSVSFKGCASKCGNALNDTLQHLEI